MSLVGTVAVLVLSLAPVATAGVGAPRVVAAVATPGISTPADVLVGEAAGHVDLPVQLNAPGTRTVSVDYATVNGSTGSGPCNNEYRGVSGTLTYPAGVTVQTVRVDINDCGVGGFSAFVFTVSNPVNATVLRASTRVGIVGDGNLSADPGVYVRDASVDTRAGTILVPILLGDTAGSASASTVSVHYATVAGTALAGTDYTAVSGTATFGPGQTVVNIPVPIIARTGAAPERRFALVVSQPVNATLIDATGIISIGATGAPAVSTPTISAPPDQLVAEAGGYLDLPVQLNAPGTRTVSVDYATVNGSTGSGPCNNEYRGVSGTLTYPAGVTVQTVRVDINDCGVGGFSAFVFTVSNPVNATVLRASTRVGIVGDGNLSADPGVYVRDASVDTRAGTILVPILLGDTAGSASASTVSVHYATVAGTALAGTDYTAVSGTATFGPGQTVVNIPVPIIARTGAAPERRFALVVSQPVNATLIDATGIISIGATGAPAVSTPTISAPPDQLVAEAGGYLDLPVQLNAPGTRTVSVDYATVNGSTGSGPCNNEYRGVSGTLTYPAGVTVQTVRVDINDCGVGGFSAFVFTVSNPVNATVLRASTRVGIVGDGNLSADPGVYVRDASVDTRAGTILVPILLGDTAGSASASTVSVHYATVAGTALAGTDYTAVSGTATFGPGQTVVNIPVPIIARTGAAPERRFALVVSQPVNATLIDATGIISIGATGAPAVSTPTISAPPDQLVAEAGGYLDLPVQLNAPGTRTVSVDYATVNGSTGSGPCNNEYRGVSGTLTYPAGVTVQTVRVDINDCGLSTSGTFFFTLSAAVDAHIGDASATITIVPQPTIPGPPRTVRATALDGAAVVTFAAPNSTGGDPINGYLVTATPGGATAHGVISPITVTGLVNGTSYTFQVRAENSVGRGARSAPSSAVTVGAPKPPTTVSAVSGSTTRATGSVIVSYTLAGDNGSPITSQTATCSSSDGGATGSATITGSVQRPITVRTLTTGDTYTCTVTATNARGAGQPSPPSRAVIVGAPAAPTGVAASRTAAGQLQVSFTPGADNGNAVTTYAATCRSSNGGVSGVGTGSSGPLSVIGLTAGARYTCTVTATNSRGTGWASAPSAPVTA